jgi:hypothetical protein
MAIGVPQRCARREARRLYGNSSEARIAAVSPAPRNAAAEKQRTLALRRAVHRTTVPADSQHHNADLPAPFPGDDQRKLLGPRAVSAVRGLFNAVSGRRRKGPAIPSSSVFHSELCSWCCAAIRWRSH